MLTGRLNHQYSIDAMLQNFWDVRGTLISGDALFESSNLIIHSKRAAFGVMSV